jgi:transcriptional regulator
MYDVDDPVLVRRTIRGHPLATLVTNGPVVPLVTHLPVISPPGVPETEELVGRSLLGHMNRANPHWKALKGGPPSVLVFTGPDGYVSPVLYAETPAAPTWDFVTVHVHGTIEPIDDSEATFDVVSSTASALEADFGAGWSKRGSEDYFRKILPAVGAFRLRVEHVYGMFKLSQEKSPEVRENVRSHFASTGLRKHDELAVVMGDLTQRRDVQ